MMRRFLLLFSMIAALVAQASENVTVGIEGHLQTELPIAGLKARAPEKNAPITLRVIASGPDGVNTRYDFRYIGLVPGRHDLRPYLLSPDGSTASGLPPIEVEIRSLLPAGTTAPLVPIPESALLRLGGYRWVLAGLGLLWLAAAFPLFRRRRKPKTSEPKPMGGTLTLTDRLRLLVAQAAAGKLGTAEKSELDRLVLSHWRERLNLQSLHPHEALMRLKGHAEAGALLRTLENWLHRRPGSVSVDLDPLLAVYTPELVVSREGKS